MIETRRLKNALVFIRRILSFVLSRKIYRYMQIETCQMQNLESGIKGGAKKQSDGFGKAIKI